MEEFFAWDYHGAPFDLFGTAHLVALLALLVFNLLLTRAKNASDRTDPQPAEVDPGLDPVDERIRLAHLVDHKRPVDGPDHAAVTDLQPDGLGFGHYVGYAQF
jgi:hypothetical protein